MTDDLRELEAEYGRILLQMEMLQNRGFEVKRLIMERQRMPKINPTPAGKKE